MFFLTLHFGLLPFVSSVRASIHFCWTNFSKSWIHAFSFFPCYLPTIALHGWATKDMRSRRWVRKLLDLLMFSNKWINQRILKSYSFLCFHLVYSSSPLGKLRCASSASSLSERFVGESSYFFVYRFMHDSCFHHFHLLSAYASMNL